MASGKFIKVKWKGSNFTFGKTQSGNLVKIPAGVEIDWGDGNTETTSSESSPTHKYTDNLEFHFININKITTIPVCMFRLCSSIIEAIIGDEIVSIGNYAFHTCSDLLSVIIGEGVTTIGEYIFHSCSNLKSAIIGSNVETIGIGLFFQCVSLEYVKLSRKITSIVNYTFYECNSLKNIIIPNKVTTIGKDAFNSCNAFTDITIPNSVISIGESAFRGCRNLVSAIIGDRVTTIGKYAFLGCVYLNTLVLPAGVSMATQAFGNIVSLNVYSKATGKEVWEDSETDIFNNSTYNIYHYSETLPELNPEQYWHWDAEGFKISMNDDNMIESPNFIVTQDGTINAVNAKLSGYIEATGGSIGGFQIQKEQLSSEYLTITSKSIELLDEGGLITIGDNNVIIGVQTINNNTIPAIISENSTFILGNKFYNISVGSGTKKIDYCGLKFVAGNVPNAIEMNIRIYHMSYKSTSLFGSTFTISFKYSNDTDIYPQNVTVEMWFRWHATGGGAYSDAKGPYKVTFSANTRYTGHDGSFSFDDVIYLIGVDNFQVAFKNPGYYTDPGWKTIPITENVNDNNVYTDKKYFIGNKGVPPIYCMGNLYPDGNDYTIGAYGAMWLQGWFTEVKYGANGSNSLSDRTVKINISNLNNIEQYSLLFDYLDPVKYQFIEGTSGRYHTGFISQEVEQAIEKAGLTTQDFAGFVKDKDNNGNEHYYLRYEEFIALNTDQIQKLKKRVAELEKQIKEIKGEN